MTTVLVTGVSGHAGGHLAARLSRGGLTVRALVRTDEQAVRASDQGWIPVRGHLTDPPTLSRALDGVDLVVNNAAYLGKPGPLYQTVNVDGSREMAERALESGVQRFVHISTVSVYGEPVPPNVDENSSLATKDPEPYLSDEGAGRARADESARSRAAGGDSTTGDDYPLDPLPVGGRNGGAHPHQGLA